MCEHDSHTKVVFTTGKIFVVISVLVLFTILSCLFSHKSSFEVFCDDDRWSGRECLISTSTILVMRWYSCLERFFSFICFWHISNLLY